MKGEQVPGITYDSVVVTGVLDANPNTYIPVSINWPGIKRLVFEVQETPFPNQPVGVLYADSMVYNITGIPCPPPVAQINHPVTQGYDQQFTHMELQNYAGSCMTFQWQVRLQDWAFRIF